MEIKNSYRQCHNRPRSIHPWRIRDDCPKSRDGFSACWSYLFNITSRHQGTVTGFLVPQILDVPHETKTLNHLDLRLALSSKPPKTMRQRLWGIFLGKE